jgi:hypothetical protein
MTGDPKKPKHPRDTNQLAKSVVDLATGDAEPPTESPQAAAGRKGGSKGGAARALALSAEERTEIARKAARARWKQEDD